MSDEIGVMNTLLRNGIFRLPNAVVILVPHSESPLDHLSASPI
jgi:hypothetical protein